MTEEKEGLPPKRGILSRHLVRKNAYEYPMQKKGKKVFASKGGKKGFLCVEWSQGPPGGGIGGFIVASQKRLLL